MFGRDSESPGLGTGILAMACARHFTLPGLNADLGFMPMTADVERFWSCARK